MIEKLFTIFKLAQNGWKLELLCGNNYPGWVRNNTNNKGSWIINKVKCEEDGGEAQAVSGGRKWKAKWSTSQGAKNKIKDKHVFK
jgi:hypothetical protein